MLAAIDAQPGEGAAAEVVDIHAQGHRQLVPRLSCPHAQVVVLEIPQAEALVQAAELLEHVAAQQQAEAQQPLRLESTAALFLPPAGGKGVEPWQAVVTRLDPLRRGS